MRCVTGRSKRLQQLADEGNCYMGKFEAYMLMLYRVVSTHLVVVHDGVHAFDPHGIDVTVENYPLHVLVWAERRPFLYIESIEEYTIGHAKHNG